MAMSMVGTTRVWVPRYVSNASRIVAGLKPGKITKVPRLAQAPNEVTAPPPMWYIGIALMYTPPSDMPARSATKVASLTRPMWCSIAPRGKPVVPEVYWTWIMSCGLTSGSGVASSPLATNASQSSSDTTARREGRSDCSCPASSRMLKPRYSSMQNSAAAPDWVRVNCISRARYAGFRATSTIPARLMPC
jgi:hypothetical protein